MHSHDIEGQLSLVIIEGEGEFLGKDGASFPAKPGDVVISDIAEPHGLRARTDLRLLVTIAPADLTRIIMAFGLPPPRKISRRGGAAEPREG